MISQNSTDQFESNYQLKRQESLFSSSSSFINNENINSNEKKEFSDSRPCYGRVHNLEDMVPTQWWTTVFDAMYLKTDGDVVEDPEITKEEIIMLEKDLELRKIFLKGHPDNVTMVDNNNSKSQGTSFLSFFSFP